MLLDGGRGLGAGAGGEALLAGWVRGGLLALGVVVLVLGVLTLAAPSWRAQALLNVGNVLNRALAMPPAARGIQASRASQRSKRLDSFRPTTPRAAPCSARGRAARFDDAGALEALQAAGQSDRADAFDMLQIARVYRELGFAQEAYTWMSRAYAAWDRQPPDRALQVYARRTRSRTPKAASRATLATQAESAMRARAFGQAVTLFQQALTFAPDNVYLRDRLGGAQRGVDRWEWALRSRSNSASGAARVAAVVADDVQHGMAEAVAAHVDGLEVGPASVSNVCRHWRDGSPWDPSSSR